MLTARYFFSQLWCEFTKEVIAEFTNEDILVRLIGSESFQHILNDFKKNVIKKTVNDERL